MEDNILEFLCMLDENALEAYNKLIQIENVDVLGLEVLNLEERLREAIKHKQVENFMERYTARVSRLSYLINSIGGEKDPELEEMFLLAARSCKLEKDCLKQLKKSLNYSAKSKDNEEHNNIISNIFLYMLVLDKLGINRCDSRKREYLKAECYYKAIYTVVPDTGMSLEKNIEKLEKVKQYAYKLPKK